LAAIDGSVAELIEEKPGPCGRAFSFAALTAPFPPLDTSASLATLRRVLSRTPRKRSAESCRCQQRVNLRHRRFVPTSPVASTLLP